MLISSYADLVAEWCAQADRSREVGDPATAAVYGRVADQLHEIACKDRESAAAWRERFEHATGAGANVRPSGLSDEQLGDLLELLGGHRVALRARERTIEGEIVAVELEIYKRGER